MKKLSSDKQLAIAIIVCIVTLVLALQDSLPMLLREICIIIALIAAAFYIVIFYRNPENRRHRRKRQDTKEQ
jgi:FtsH-binding integral membrane protein